MAIKDSRYVSGAAKLGRRISTIRQRYNVEDLTAEIGQLLLRRTLDRFAREVDPDGTPWEDLAPFTLRRKKALGYGNKQKLERTGALKRSIKLIRGTAAGSIFTNTGAGVRIGVNDTSVVDYARIQNYGAGRVPARRFLGIGALDVKAVDSFLRRRAAAVQREITNG